MNQITLLFKKIAIKILRNRFLNHISFRLLENYLIINSNQIKFSPQLQSHKIAFFASFKTKFNTFCIKKITYLLIKFKSEI